MHKLYKRPLGVLPLGLGLALAAAPAFAADQRIEAVPGGLIITPGSSLPQGAGFMHTNVHIFVPNNQPPSTMPSGRFENPASLACLYGLTAKVTGCNPETLKTVATGGAKIVAIVDAYDDPTAQNDLSVYSTQYGLPPITSQNFAVVYASGTKPGQDSTGGWEFEESLDIEMAHALAPNAMVVLVEAKSNSGNDLLAAEKVATKLVAAAGGGEVSNSWSGGEFAGEEKTESDFVGTNVVYFASAGDKPGTGWPSVLSNVVSVGGTDINRDSKGNFVSQTSWSSTGGGKSTYVLRPPYQNSVKTIVGTQRGTPDVALVADPATGVWVYDTTLYHGINLQWAVAGGTSVASPAIAGIINNAGKFAASTPAELTVAYAAAGHPAKWTYITSGTCPNDPSGQAMSGYDFCTGIGTPLGRKGK